jgi:outer membrane protein assembly factor BamB
MTAMIQTSLLLMVVSALAAGGPAASGGAGNWPQWRGPQGTGLSAESGLPREWSEEGSVIWKLKLPEWGTSTPAIWGDALFVTAHQGDDLLLLSISKKSGRIDWTRKVGSEAAPRMPLRIKNPEERRAQRFHQVHNYASPSPVTDGERVVVHFGNGELAAYDFSGNRKWSRNLAVDHGPYTIWWGHANSPVLHGDLVISVCMQDSLADLGGPVSPSYLVAHDKRTGEERWKTLRKTQATAEQCDSYTTPVFHRTAGGVEMVVIGGNQLDGYDPATGKQLWFLPGITGNRTITGAVVAEDRAYCTIGMHGAFLSVKLGGRGELPRESIAWKEEKATPDSPSPLITGGLVFLVTDGGIASCLDARSGKLHWRERLGGDFRASPIAAEGKIYCVNMAGVTSVLAASPTFEKLAENTLADEVIASPAVSEGRLFIRGRRSLYSLGKR